MAETTIKVYVDNTNIDITLEKVCELHNCLKKAKILAKEIEDMKV